MRKIALICFGLISINATNLNQVESIDAVITKSISLNDKEEYVLNQSFGSCWCCAHQETNVLGFEVDVLPQTPLIIKSYETKITPFFMLKNYAFDAFSEPCAFSLNRHSFASTNKLLVYRAKGSNQNEIDFPDYKISYNGGSKHNLQTTNIIDAWDYGSDHLLPFFHTLLKSSSARKEIFNYVITSFNKISNYYPSSVKKNIIKILADLEHFTANYGANRNTYVDLLNKNKDLVKEIGFYRSFVFRRIENDKIPLSEIKKYINELKKTINMDIADSPLKSYLKININNSDIILIDAENGWEISNPNSSEVINLNSFKSIKCIKVDHINYYLINTGVKELFVDNKLNIIDRN